MREVDGCLGCYFYLTLSLEAIGRNSNSICVSTAHSGETSRRSNLKLYIRKEHKRSPRRDVPVYTNNSRYMATYRSQSLVGQANGSS